MVLRGSGGGRAVEFDVAARGESCPAVERHDHRRVDAQELACGGKGDEVGFGAVAARGTCKCAVGAGKGSLGSVREEEDLRAGCVGGFLRGGEGGGEVGREQDVVFKDERGGDVLLDHAAVDGVVGERAADLSGGVETAAREYRVETGDGGASVGGREGGAVHGRYALGMHAGLRETSLCACESIGMPVKVDEKRCHGK